MPKDTRKRLEIRCAYTNREWNIIEANIGNSNPLYHIITESNKIKNTPQPALQIPTTKKSRTFRPNPETMKIIQELAKERGIQPSTFVSRYIFSPLLNSK